MVVAALLTLAVLFGVATNKSEANTVQSDKYVLHNINYKGYVIQGACPTKAQRKHWAKTHKGAERWRLDAIKMTYRMINLVVAHKSGWKYVWNVDWVIQIANRESGGNPTATNGRYWGLMQVDHVGRSNQRSLFTPIYNLWVSSKMFAQPGILGQTHPWSTRNLVSAQSLAKRVH